MVGSPAPPSQPSSPMAIKKEGTNIVQPCTSLPCNFSPPPINLPFGKKHRVNKFYKQQCDLLENYENDSKQIRDERNRRSMRLPNSTDTDPESQLLANGDGEFPDELSLGASRSSLVAATKESNGEIAAPPPPNPVPRIDLHSNEDDDVYCPTVQSASPRPTSSNQKRRQLRNRAQLLAKITLFVNLSLTIAKGVASYLSGSLSILSSLVDSLVDITSGLVIWATSRAIRKHDPYHYPTGRTRLEPLALVIVSVIMAVASVQMVVQSLDSMINNKIHPHVDLPTLIIMIVTIFTKLILFFVCRKFRDDPSSQVLAQDHRNDCISNTLALICAFCAQRYWIYLDPLGAIAVALYIAATWYMTGKEQLVRLSGKTAKPEFINRVIKICIDHSERIDYIDTVYVYHFGTRFFVEVHIVMDENMRLKEAHDISESLQNSIEALPDVERAFVHVDYEFDHKPADEHKHPVA